ncbi:L-threonylcarbamoyladenylate synthase [Nonlabens xiamenensis]|uniref:L-threonylcarbamoyladenylate synthase n=1 Tax=Nonlabens xiamenensis TaxID=2341043 RepID=UPI000F60D8C0|nr:L-threonylcarbamoyladenylate synthase [Nonlabens xiamenensis]
MGRSDRQRNRRDQVRGRKPKKDPQDNIELPLEAINQAVTALKKGGTLLYPTDTIYGLGCDATNYDAVEKIYQIKERDKSKSLLVLVDSFQMLESIIEEVPDMAWEVLKVNKKPLTIIYDRPKNVAENVLAADESLAVRVTNDPVCRAMIRKLRKPIVSTSANLSGEPSPVHFSDINPALIERVDHVLDLPLAHKNIKPSSIMKISNNGVIKIIRS